MKQDNATITKTQNYYTQKNVEIPSHEMNIFREQTTVGNRATLEHILLAIR